MSAPANIAVDFGEARAEADLEHGLDELRHELKTAPEWSEGAWSGRRRLLVPTRQMLKRAIERRQAIAAANERIQRGEG